MELSKFTIGLIFIFLPGIVALIISERLTEHGERKGHELFAYALVLGCIAHVLYGLVRHLLNGAPIVPLEKDRWIVLMLNNHSTIQGQVVGITAVIGVLLGLFVAFSANHSWLHRFANNINVSKKFSDIDVWTHLMNLQGLQWVVLRDHSKNLMYQGYVRAFSGAEETRELCLSDASVFVNNSAEKMYDVPLLYLSFDKKDVALEIF
ncbi:MAG: DUF6338 family protein [Acidiferrobacteraceae bacterium]